MKFGITLLLAVSCLCAGAQIPSKIEKFHLSDVELLDSPFKVAEQRDKEYMLALDADRLLAPYLREAGLTPKAESYTNWENTGLDGHIGGHYVSALSLMYASTGDKDIKARLDYMIDELKRCQDHLGTGYIGGVPGGVAMWNEIKSGDIRPGAFELNKKWVPLYNIHKVYAGLRDAYLYAGSEKALAMLIKLTDWCIDLTAGLTDEQMQNMLRSEHGGLNETFADVARLTGDDKYLKLAHRFSHNQTLEPLLKGEDRLTGRHANTQIPKVIGYKSIADLEGNEAWDRASAFFWETVVANRSVSIGGNSVRENFHPADNFSSMMTDRQGPETCNTYNMMRLSAMLFQTTFDEKYMDYYERAMYNHILSTEHPEHGGFVYFTSMRPGHYRVYSQPQTSFWCCVGSGLENHAKYGEWIYSRSGDDLYVNMFVPSRLDWKDKKVEVTQNTSFPDSEEVNIKIAAKKKTKFTLNIRYPKWVADKATIKVNGRGVPFTVEKGSYISIDRKWKDGDIVNVNFPMDIHLEQLPDKSANYSILYGPVVLAARMGTEDMPGLYADDARMAHVAHGSYIPLNEMPVLVGSPSDITASIKPVEGKPLTFKIQSGIYPAKYDGLELEPFFRVHESRYAVYFPQTTPEELRIEQERVAREEAQRMAVENRTVDVVYAGEQQPESDHGFKSEASTVGISNEQRWRAAEGWFSYIMDTKGEKELSLRVTYYGDNSGRKFHIMVNGNVIHSFTGDSQNSNKFYDVDYAIPAGALTEKIEVKFIAHENARTAEIYEVRLMKK